jgi:LAO/AO transport system kinase
MPDQKEKNNSALKVNKGIMQPEAINKDVAGKFKGLKPKGKSIQEYVEGILAGDRTVLSQAITLSESTLARHQEVAQEIIKGCIPYAGRSIRVGITGVPGVGKSTFIESLGKFLTAGGYKIAVLAIDPSSQRSKGSILGDKTRMEELANDPNAYVRPSSSAGSLGGVTRKTRETIILCEAAGYDVILVETVGVGQSETAVHSMVDFFMLLMLAGAGDELQGIKRGIMEMADALVINKADGDNVERAKLAAAEYENALHLFPPAESGWTPAVKICSSIEKSGIKEVWKMVEDYQTQTTQNGFFEQNRKTQLLHALDETIEDTLRSSFFSDHDISTYIEKARKNIVNGETSPYQAARDLLQAYFTNLKES